MLLYFTMIAEYAHMIHMFIRLSNWSFVFYQKVNIEDILNVNRMSLTILTV